MPTLSLTELKQIQLLQQLLKSFSELVDNGMSIDNFDEVKLHIRTELNALSTRFKTVVDGLPIPQVNVPNDLKVDIKSASSIEKLLQELTEKEYRPTINVDVPKIETPKIDIPEIVIPKIEVPKVDVNVNPEIDLDFTPLLKALKPLNLLSDRATRPLSVRLSNGKEFIKALKQVTDTAEKQIYAFSQSTGMTQDEFKTTSRDIEDKLAGYQIADKDADASPNYYGLLRADRRWYILKETINAGADTYRYAAGSSDYSTNWTNRLSLSYDYISEVSF